ncbi:MAG: hypothetical protein AAF943_11540, partial [Pseudomonadota bacterium]
LSHQKPSFDKDELEKATQKIEQLMFDLDFGDSVPPWLSNAFVGVAVWSICDTTQALARLERNGTLPVRYSDFQDANEEASLSCSVVDLLISEYFATGIIASGATRADIRLYDPDLIIELEHYEATQGSLPKELYIPRDQFEADKGVHSTFEAGQTPTLSKS